MAISHHMKPGLTNKSRVKIMTVDVTNRHIEAAFKDGSMIHIPIWNTGHAFRWPKTEEEWIVRRDDGMWTLDHRVQKAKDPNDHPITDMQPGHMKLDADTIVDSQGNRLATVTAPAPAPPSLIFYGSLMAQRVRSGVGKTSVTL